MNDTPNPLRGVTLDHGPLIERLSQEAGRPVELIDGELHFIDRRRDPWQRRLWALRRPVFAWQRR